MPRYAPTLFVGLGGSGVAVLRRLKDRLGREDGNEPVAFRGIDFDDSNSGGDHGKSLDAGEFFAFDPTPIAEAVRSLTAGVRSVGNGASTPAFEPIREWYPDLDGTSIRYSQAEAAGARQWRPLGRVGFFLYDEEILGALRSGLAEVDSRRGNRGARSKPTVYLVSSIVGGTGAGMLFDVAASLRRLRRDLAVRAVLLLPEFFEHVDFGGKVLANAYGTILELANLKNQHFDFIARYLRIPEVDRRQSTPPLQRIYILGPYIGDRRPFLLPGEAYPHVADMLQVLITDELRANATSFQANADADGAVTLDDPAARDVFSSFSGGAIRLVSYDYLGRLVARTIVQEAGDANGDHPLLDLLQPRATPDEIREIADEIETTAGKANARVQLSHTNIAALLDAYIDEISPKRWNAEKLKEYVEKLTAFAEEFPEGAATETDRETLSRGPLDAASRRFREKLGDRIATLRTKFELHPHAFRDALTELLNRARRELNLRRPDRIEHLADFPGWIDSRFGFLLTIPLLRRHRLQKLREHILDALKKRFETEGPALFEQAIRYAAVRLLEQERKKENTAWADIAPFRARVVASVRDDDNEEKRSSDRMSIGPVDADPVPLLENELERIKDVALRISLKKTILEINRAKLREFADDPKAAEELAEEIGRELEKEWARSGSQHHKYVSPLLTFGEGAIREFVAKCATQTFRVGRVDALVRHRTARVSVPQDFAGREEFIKILNALCDSVLGARVQTVHAAKDEDRVLILVEDLFHPAEEIAGIYDYFNDYSKRPRKELFHIDRRLPSLFPQLLTAAGSRGPVECGNPRCNADIRNLPPETLICAKCGQPIRNRCGNPGCPANNLSTRKNIDEIVASGICPDCSGVLQTYWWDCARHQARVPMDKPHCPQCVRARVKPEKRPGFGDEFVCPACAEREVPKPFVAKGTAAHAMRYGANGQTVATVLRELDEILPDGKSCPKCGTLLVPLCPISTSPRHLVHRDSSDEPWVCYTHPEETFLRCNTCAFPVRGEDVHCPRCGTELADCGFCTEFLGTRVPKHERGERCPNCALRDPDTPLRKGNCRDVANEVFCSNIYGCPAAAHLTTATFPPEHARCPICRDPELHPLRVYTRPTHISACSFCRALFPEAIDFSQPTRNDERHCCLCGQKTAETTVLTADKESHEAMLTIARGLLHHRDEDDVLREIYMKLPRASRDVAPALLVDFAKRIVRRETQRVVVPRIERLLKLHERQFGCESCRDDTSSSESLLTVEPEDGRDSGARVPPSDILSADYIRSLLGDDAIRQWVDDLIAANVGEEAFEAALGGAISETFDDVLRKRLEHMRETARRRFRDSGD